MSKIIDTIIFTNQEIATNFVSLLGDMDFSYEFELLEISAYNFIQKRKMLFQFKAAYIALWLLALERSFPNEKENILLLFINSRNTKVKNAEENAKLHYLVLELSEILAEKKDKDFSPLSLYLININGKKIPKNTILKLALRLRSVYTYIFKHLTPTIS